MDGAEFSAFGWGRSLANVSYREGVTCWGHVLSGPCSGGNLVAPGPLPAHPGADYGIPTSTGDPGRQVAGAPGIRAVPGGAGACTGEDRRNEMAAGLAGEGAFPSLARCSQRALVLPDAFYGEVCHRGRESCK